MTTTQLKQIARQYAEQGKNWHFHILTPKCQLNEVDKYAIVLENTTDNEFYVVYSEDPQMEIGQELVALLHGKDVIKKASSKDSVSPSEQVQRLLDRAKQLTTKGVFWHHHTLFPGCKYNKHVGKWVIVFEDQEKGEIIESLTDDEPKSDLQYIEGLFYKQSRPR